jgi:hypothetical protein
VLPTEARRVDNRREKLEKHAATRALVAVMVAITMIAVASCAGRPRNPESYVLSLFKGEATTKSDAWRIVKTLPSVDWGKMYRLDSDRMFQLLDWLDSPAVGNTKRAMPFVMRSYIGLDGAHAEKYSIILGHLYETQGGPEFIRALGRLDATGRETDARLLVYNWSYKEDRLSLRAEVEAFGQSPGLSSSDKEAVATILRAFDALLEDRGG